MNPGARNGRRSAGGSRSSRSGSAASSRATRGAAKGSGKASGKASARGSVKGSGNASGKVSAKASAKASARGPAKGAKSPKSRAPMSAAAVKAVEAKRARHAAASVRKSDRPGAPRRRAGGGDRPIPRGQSAPKGLGGEQVEGRQAVRELLLAGRRRVREILVVEEQDDAEVLQDIVDLALDLKVPVREVTRTRLFSQARTEAPQGVVARAAELEDHLLEDLARRNSRDGAPPFLLALDGVTDPGNLGALLRSAECAGVTGVVLPRHRAVHITPTVTKAAAGAVEYLPMSLVGGLPNALRQLTELGVWVIGLDMGGETNLFDLAVADQPVCVVMGAEGKGLSRLVRERCDAIVNIPLQGELASLNVSAAGALACYEVARQRLRNRSAD